VFAHECFTDLAVFRGFCNQQIKGEQFAWMPQLAFVTLPKDIGTM
jgi:hypothetical protein